MQPFMASTHRNGWGTTPSGLPQRFEPLTPSATRKTATSTTSTLLITDAGLDDAHLAELSAAGLTVERRTRADSSQPFGGGLQVCGRSEFEVCQVGGYGGESESFGESA
jgi:hypothetical protein